MSKTPNKEVGSILPKSDDSPTVHRSRIIPTLEEDDCDDGEESQHVWGFADTKYRVTECGDVEITGNRYASSGQKLPSLLPWITGVMKVTIPTKQQPPVSLSPETLPPASVNEEFLKKMRVALEDDQISLDPLTRLRHGHGHALQDIYEVNYSPGLITRIPDVVLYPTSTAQVQSIVSAARETNTCLLPTGGGTNVSRALHCPDGEERTIAAVSTRRLRRVLWIDRENRLARIEAGGVGRDIARTLGRYGMTLGHEPDSVEFSTLGGWIATKASGMKRGRYGNIEDIVLDVEMVTPDGVLARATDETPPRESVGVDLRSWAFGSEGTLGVITSAVVKIFPRPEVQRYGSILFRSFDAGLSFMHDLAQMHHHQPASARLVDNAQFQFSMALKPAATGLLRAAKGALQRAYVTRVRGFDPARMVACTLVFEGRGDEVKAQEAVVYGLAGKRHGGLRAGGENGRRGYEMTFAIAYIRDFAMGLRILAESFETSCAWTDAPRLCARVKDRVRADHARLGLPGHPFVSARVSQVYHTGATVYFYLAVFAGDVADPAGAYAVLEEAARDEILACGGSLSHHHGVGTLRRSFLPRVLSPAALAFRHRIWEAADPDGIFHLAHGCD